MSKIVCVTACPTGIAHTYIAAEMLEVSGKALGYDMVVETHGAIGVDHKLKSADIDEAIGVIIAADIKIDLKRFAQKVVIETTTQEAIKDPKKLIDRLLFLIKGRRA